MHFSLELYKTLRPFDVPFSSVFLRLLHTRPGRITSSPHTQTSEHHDTCFLKETPHNLCLATLPFLPRHSHLNETPTKARSMHKQTLTSSSCIQFRSCKHPHHTYTQQTIHSVSFCVSNFFTQSQKECSISMKSSTSCHTKLKCTRKAKVRWIKNPTKSSSLDRNHFSMTFACRFCSHCMRARNSQDVLFFNWTMYFYWVLVEEKDSMWWTRFVGNALFSVDTQHLFLKIVSNTLTKEHTFL